MSAMTDVAAERAVLAGLFSHGAHAYTDVADLVTAKTFSTESGQVIYRCLDHHLRDHPDGEVDLPSLLSAAQSLGLAERLEDPEERRYLRALINFPVKLDTVRRLAAKLRKLEIARLLHTQLEQAQRGLEESTGDEPIDHLLGLAEQPIFDLTSLLSDTSTGSTQRLGEGVTGYLDHLASNPRQTVGISTGYAMYDRAIGGGLRPKTVNLIGARPKTGKTLLADNISLHIAGKLGIPVLNLDTEMSKEDHWNRLLACLSGVTIDDIETGRFASCSHKQAAVYAAAQKLEAMPLDYLSIAGQPFEETLSAMRRWRKQVGLDKPCVIVFDYLKLMSSDAMDNKQLAEFQVLGFIMTALHNFMVRWDAACLAFVQLNRDGINREDTDVVSQSDRLIWLCSNFSIYKKQAEEEIAAQAGQKKVYNRKLVPIVARHGAGLEDGDYINMLSQGAIARIEEGPTKSQQGNNSSTQPGGVLVDADEQDEVSFGGA